MYGHYQMHFDPFSFSIISVDRITTVSTHMEKRIEEWTENESVTK